MGQFASLSRHLAPRGKLLFGRLPFGLVIIMSSRVELFEHFSSLAVFRPM